MMLKNIRLVGDLRNDILVGYDSETFGETSTSRNINHDYHRDVDENVLCSCNND